MLAVLQGLNFWLVASCSVADHVCFSASGSGSVIICTDPDPDPFKIKKKNLGEKIIFVDILKATDEKSRIRIHNYPLCCGS
jgi:hypothetical protein